MFIFVQVKLHDGSVHTGVVEDFDVHSDLATIRINKVVLLYSSICRSISLLCYLFI